MLAVDRDVFPASYAQEGLWLLAQFAPDLPLYQVTVPLRLRLPLRAGHIEAALATIARRHETLRTSLELQDDALVQVVHAEIVPPVRHTDLAALPPAETRQRLTEVFHGEAGTPLPLGTAPLWRAHAVRCAGDDWTVVVVAHHAVFDATSIMVLRRELRELAEAAVTGRPPDLPDLQIQYADFADWQRRQVADGAYAGDLSYWRDVLAGAPEVHGLPTDRPRPAMATFAGGEVHFVVPPDTVRGLHRVARECGATPFMVVLAAYQALISRLSGGTDVVVGTPVAGRDLPELQPLIGMFVNTLVLRTDLSGDPPFADLVERARATLLGAWEHPAVPFDVLVAALAPRREPGRNPLFQIGLNYLPARGAAGGGAEWTSLAHEESFTLDERARAARFDLHLDLTEHGDRIVGMIEYASDLFDRESVRAFAARFTRLLTAAVREPETRLSRLPVLAPDERARLLAARPDADAAPHTARGVIPDGVAGDLRRRADTLAAELVRLGAGRDRPVAVVLPPGDPEFPVAVLGGLATGAPVVPLDADQPAPRLRFLLADARPAVVLDSDGPRASTVDDGDPEPCVDDDPVALIEYAAVTTGLPRAVAVTRSALAAQAAQAAEVLGSAAGATYAFVPPVPAATLLAAVATGGTVRLAVAPADHLVLPYARLLDLLRTGGDVTTWLPRRLLVVDGGPADREGGPLWSLLLDALARRPGCAAVRRFGYTEVSGPAFVRTVGGDGGALGRPLGRTAAYVLEGHLEPAPDGAVGELYLGGPAVAAGYLRRPEPTAARFVIHPHLPGSTRLFRTGTLVSRHRDGTFEPR